MPFEFKKLVNHGINNPIVARLSLQTLEVLKNCKADQKVKDAVGTLYTDSLMPKLLRCWEVEDAFNKSREQGEVEYKPPAQPNAPVQIPQIEKLEQDAHNFLYEAKNYIRDLLYVFNKLDGTSFSEASEFFKAKKGSKSLLEFMAEKFGLENQRTKWLKEAAPLVEELIAMRNAVEHPSGYSGSLVIENFRRCQDQKLLEPTWYRVKDGKTITEPSSMRADYRTAIDGLLNLGDDLLAMWASDNLEAPDMMQIGYIPEDQRDQKNPAKYKVMPSDRLLAAFKELPRQQG
jgi:hypothetical protein